MTIYELENMATPGPFILADKEYYTAEPHSLVAASDRDRKIAELYTENDADDILFAHCRNNFLRALEALKIAGEEGLDWEVRAHIRHLVQELETIA